MTAVSVVFFILGAILSVAGSVFVFLGRFEEPPEKDEDSLTIGDVMERVNAVVVKIEKRYRWGIVMIALGLALVGAAAWLAALSAASNTAPPSP